MVSSAAMTAPLFVANLVLVVALLVATLWSGRNRRRRAHYVLAVSTLVALALAIVQAELFGRHFTFPALRLTVHLGFATVALVTIPAVVYTGLRLRRDGRWRSWHRRFVTSFVAFTVASVLTAVWMFLGAEARSG